MKLEIKALKIPFYLGVYEYEKTTIATVIFDITIELDLKNFLQNKDLKNSINYDILIQMFTQKFTNSYFDLIENVCIEAVNIIKKNDTNNLIKLGFVKVCKQNTHKNVELVCATLGF